MRADAPPRLWHLEISNFNEKARWALDYKRISHRRRAIFPGFHMACALGLTRRSVTFPVLQIGGKVLGDSTEIIAELERRYPEPPLYPADSDARRRALELEEHFDEHLGPHVRRAALWELIKRPEYMGIGKLGQAWFSNGVRQRYELGDDTAARSLEKVHQALDLIEDTLDGRDHLVGDEFTVADLAAAALTGPALRPPEIPYVAELPLPDNLQRISDGIRARPAGQWILRTYSRYRYGPGEQPEVGVPATKVGGMATPSGV